LLKATEANSYWQIYAACSSMGLLERLLIAGMESKAGIQKMRRPAHL
jgi:hypothetical protein